MIDFQLLALEQLVGAASVGLLFGFAFNVHSRGGAGLRLLWVVAPLGAGLVAFLAGAAHWSAAQQDLDPNAAQTGAAAYFAGLLLGAAARIVSTPAQARVASPSKSAAPAPKSVSPAPKSVAARVAPEPMPAPAAEPAAAQSPAKKAPGAPPPFLPAPRGGLADDLSLIKTLGPKSVERLNAMGVYHFDQIAEWSLDNARWIGAALGGPGRVERGKWIQQARDILAAKKAS
jgi:predicted flap endonuclease-1-like 5' DNA nuclease